METAVLAQTRDTQFTHARADHPHHRNKPAMRQTAPQLHSQKHRKIAQAATYITYSLITITTTTNAEGQATPEHSASAPKAIVTPRASSWIAKSCTSHEFHFAVINTGSVNIGVTGLKANPSFFSVATGTPHGYIDLAPGSIHEFALTFTTQESSHLSQDTIEITFTYSSSATSAERTRIERSIAQPMREAFRIWRTLRDRGPTTPKEDRQIAELRTDWTAEQTKLDHEIELARKRIDEYRLGLFCSKCGKSKSEIEEATNAPFLSHLSEVRGVPVPASPERMQSALSNLQQKEAALSAAQARFASSLNAALQSRTIAIQQYENDVAKAFQNYESLRRAFDQASRRYTEMSQFLETSTATISIKCGNNQ